MSADRDAELERLRRWVADLQSGMYVNCVYCGHRYGPGETTPVSMADALKAHVAQCPEHPMAACVAALKGVDAAIDEVKRAFGAPGDWGYQSREGQALYTLYLARPPVAAAIALAEARTGSGEATDA